MHGPITDQTPRRFADPLPARADVVVIGGGIMGVMTAWHLRAQGLSVVVCEKGRVAGEQSSRNWGWIRQQGRDAAELPIMIEAAAMWPGLSAAAGVDLGYRRTGVMYIARTEAQRAGHEAFLRLARGHDLDTKMLTADQVRARLPGAGDWPGGILGGMITESDGRAEPWVTVPALAAALQGQGGTIREDCAVRCLDIAAGRVAGVVTEAGRIACDAVVLAGGSWSSLFLRNHGVSLPQLSVISTAAQTVPMGAGPEVAASDGALAFRRRLDGGFTIAPGNAHEFCLGPDAFRHVRAFLPELRKDPFGALYRLTSPKDFPDAWGTPRRWSAEARSPFEAMRVLAPRPHMKTLAVVQDLFAKAFPTLGRPKIRHAWAGMIDTLPDVVPVVDHIAALPGLVVATGLSGHGFGIAPGLGRVVADMVTGRPVGHDLSRFRFGRFSDGSRIEGGPTL
ncbi:MAG: FAD-binding oxidoreductase [Paracoccaceae bacterium]|nr:FAD-binding oxidoreductase [Paracoccaceae bacterium]